MDRKGAASHDHHQRWWLEYVSRSKRPKNGEPLKRPSVESSRVDYPYWLENDSTSEVVLPEEDSTFDSSGSAYLIRRINCTLPELSNPGSLPGRAGGLPRLIIEKLKEWAVDKTGADPLGLIDPIVDATDNALKSLELIAEAIDQRVGGSLQ